MVVEVRSSRSALTIEEEILGQNDDPYGLPSPTIVFLV